MTAAAPQRLLLIHGDEPFLVDENARAWLAAARARTASDLNVEVFDAPPRVDAVRRSVAEVPFLDETRYVVVRDPPQLAERARRGADPPEALVAIVTERAPTTALCIVAHARVAPTHPLLKAVETAGGAVVHHAALRTYEVRDWAGRRCRAHGLTLAQGGLEHILRVAGNDLGIVAAEISKLAAYAEGRPRLTDDEVRRLVGGAEQVDVWDVVERLLSPPHGAGAAAVDSLLNGGMAPQQLIGILAGQFRELLQAAEILADRAGGAAALTRALGIPQWRAERLARRVRAVTPDVVEVWIRELQRIDSESKAGRMDDGAALRAFALRAARQAGALGGRAVATRRPAATAP